MADPLHPDRLLRKRNSNLQKQLEVTLQILSEEYRQCKERWYKEERDCGKFLQSLYEVVPGLQNYGHPNTRSMNATAVLQDRKFSTAPPFTPDTDHTSTADLNGNPPPRQDSTGPSSAPPSADSRRRPVWGHNPREKRSAVKLPDQKRVRHDPGSGPLRRQGQGRGVGTQGLKRPQTADSCPSQRLVDRDHRPDRPATSFGFRRSTRPCFGKNAYSDHDRLVHEMVLKKFQSIFDPEVKYDPTRMAAAKSDMTQNPKSTSEDQQSSSSDDIKDQGSQSAEDDDDDDDALKAGQTSGGERSVHQRHYHRRVVWSARPHRRVASVCAPDVKDSGRPASGTALTTAPLGHKPRSYSLSLPSGSHQTGTLNGHDPLDRSHVDPQTAASALLKNLPPNAGSNSHPEEPKSRPGCKGHGASQSLNGRQGATDPKAQDRSRLTKATRRPSLFSKSKSDSNILKKTQTRENLNHRKTDTSSQRHGPATTTTTTTTATTTTRSGRRRHSTVSTRRVSEVSMPPDQLVDRLVNAGRTPCGKAARPRPPPLKSELSHRLLPVSRKTIVGILSEIENQRASTRTMLSTSKDLQQLVKDMVPIEYTLDQDSD